MLVENQVSLQPYNTFGIQARAHHWVRVDSLSTLESLHRSHPAWLRSQPLVLGGGSNLVLTGDVDRLVLKIDIQGRRLVADTPTHWVVEAGAGESWHGFVEWTLAQGWPGLENLALIPGSVGASPVQNIGAYGVELQDRFHSLDAFDLHTGQVFSLDAAQCGFGYRDSVFKHAAPAGQALHLHMGLAGRALITRVRFSLPKRWVPELGYLELARRRDEAAADEANWQPTPRQVFDWVCDIRRAKLPDPAVLGNAGSFFKNPTVTPEQCADIIGRDPKVVHYPLPDGRIKLAAGWLIDACGWKGKSVGQAGVYDKQALVLVNRGTPEQPCTGGQVMTLAGAIQTSVYERFGLRLDIEPVVV